MSLTTSIQYCCKCGKLFQLTEEQKALKEHSVVYGKCKKCLPQDQAEKTEVGGGLLFQTSSCDEEQPEIKKGSVELYVNGFSLFDFLRELQTQNPKKITLIKTNGSWLVRYELE